MIDVYATTIKVHGIPVPIIGQLRMRVKGKQLQGQPFVALSAPAYAEELGLIANADNWIILHEFESNAEAAAWKIDNPHIVGVV